MTAAGEPGAGGTEVSALLQSLAGGDREALNALFPLVYGELSRLAHRHRQRWDGDLTLNTTALVHEAYLKLAGQHRLPGESRAHFLALAAQAMRHILCNYARDRRRQKRGGAEPHLSLDAPGRVEAAAGREAEGLELSPDQTDRLAALDESVIGLKTHIVAESKEVTILADKSVPFSVVKKVMSTCTSQGYARISLAVMQQESESTQIAKTQI